MGRRHKPPRRHYPLHQSPLYRCRSKKRLASLLNEPLAVLQNLANGDDQYRVFSIRQRGKLRKIQTPISRRERVHARLFHLLRRIEPPPYLHSGVPGRSNVTNARLHVGAHPVRKIDVKSFYESVNCGHLYHAFRELMGCSPDVAGLLAGLTTYDNHVPTGSTVSQHLAFWGLRPVLDAYSDLCAAHDVQFSVYVDDITISGHAASRALLFELKRLLHRRGLTYHKEKSYRSEQPKLVTGVIVTAGGIRVRNRQHQRIYEEAYSLLGEKPSPVNAKDFARLRGRIASASQIDPNIGPSAKAILARKE